jgi:transposase
MYGKELVCHQEGQNEPVDILAFITKLKMYSGFTIGKSVFCMEHTGYYCNHLFSVFRRLKANVIVEDALQIKKSLGTIRGKNDKIDAIRIVCYVQKNKDNIKLWKPRRPELLALANALSVRNRLLGVSVALSTALKEESGFVSKVVKKNNEKLFDKTISAVKLDLLDAELLVKKLIDSDERLRRLKELITSVPSVGIITAVRIIVCTNEFRDIKSPQKFACYAGVVPFKKESGLKVTRAKVSPIANRKMKSLLHLCALCSLRIDAELKAYYERKTKIEGKPKLAVVNAIRNKLVLRIFACVNQDRCFIRNYQPQQTITAGELTRSQSL